MKVLHISATAVVIGVYSMLAACGHDHGAEYLSEQIVESKGAAEASSGTSTSPDYHRAISVDDLLEDDPSFWNKRPGFRASFKSCWRSATDSESQLDCINSEMSFLDETIPRISDDLRRLLPESEWVFLQEDIQRDLPDSDSSCLFGAPDQGLTGEYFCRLYQKAVLANQLKVQLELAQQ